MSGKELRTAGTGSDKDRTFQVEVTIPVRQRHRESRNCAEPAAESKPVDGPQIPRIARLMALAIKFQDMVDRGEVCDYANIARLGYVSRARLTQIMNLLLLAPDIQEEFLVLESVEIAKMSISERRLRTLVGDPNWQNQRSAWAIMKSRVDQ